MNRNVDKVVDTDCAIVIYALIVDVVPGDVAAKAVKILTPSRWVLGGLLMTAPILGFY